MHKSVSALANKMHKIIGNVGIETDHLVTARMPYLVIIYKKKRTCRREDFDVQVDNWVKINENEEINT